MYSNEAIASLFVFIRAAARRCTKYWACRRKTFGEERWLKPITLDPGGALTDQDLELVKSGWYTFVNRGIPKGRIMLVDHSKNAKFPMDCRERVLFAFCTLCSDEEAQENGITYIRLLSPESALPSPTKERIRLAKYIWNLSKTAFPLKVGKVLMLEPETSPKGQLTRLFYQRVASIIGDLVGIDRPQTVRVKSASQAYQKLKTFGIPRECVPVDHGGSWKGRVLDWTKSQTTNAETKPKSTPKRHREESPSDSDESNASPKPDTVNSQGNRSNNAIYCARAYDKRKRKHVELQENAMRLQSEHDGLLRDNTRLQILFQQAMSVISSIDQHHHHQNYHHHQQGMSSWVSSGPHGL